MPQVPKYQRQVTSTPYPGARRTPEQEGAGVGAAIAGAGEALANVGGAFANALVYERQEKVDRTVMQTATRQTQELEQSLLYDRERGAITTVHGKDALGVRDRYLPQFDDGLGQIEASMNPRQRAAFQNVRESIRSQMATRLVDHELTEYDAYEKGEAVASLSMSGSRAIANADKPEIVNEELTRINTTVDDNPDALGLKGKAAITEFKQNLHSKVYEGVISKLLVEGKTAGAKRYFEEAKLAEQLSGEAIARIEEKLDEATTRLEGQRAADAVWKDLGPTDDNDSIDLDVMERALREQFKNEGDTKKYDAALVYLQSRAGVVNAGRREREDKTLSTLWGGLLAGKSLEQVTATEEFINAPGRVKIQLRDYVRQQLEHQANLDYLAAARGAARESATYQRIVREQNLEEIKNWNAYATLSDPTSLKAMTRGQVLAHTADLGPRLTQKLLDDWDQVQRRGEQSVTVDRDMFNDVAASVFGDWVYRTPGQRGATRNGREQNAQLSQAMDAVKMEIARQQSGGKELSLEAKRVIAEDIFSQQVRVPGRIFGNTLLPGAVVNAQDRAKAYVPLADVDAQPRVYGNAYTQALNYLRGQPGNANKTDAELRAQFGKNIERAMGRSLTGGSRADIEAALRGQ